MAVRQVQFAVDGETGSRKDKLKKVTWPMIVEAGIKYYEQEQNNETKEPEEPKEEKETEERYYFKLEPEKNILVREFDILSEGKLWLTKPFDEIEMGEVFRVRDDASVLVVEGYKKFKKMGNPIQRNNVDYVEVIALK